MTTMVLGATEVLKKTLEEFCGNDPERIERLSKHPVAQLIAALPFASECLKPEELAAAHLQILLTAAKDHTSYPHMPGMSLRDRLQPIDNFSTARKPRVAEKGLLYLELLSLNDHRTDQKADAAATPPKYNPLNDGLAYDVEKRRIEGKMDLIGPTDVDPLIALAQMSALDICVWICW